MVHRTRGLGSTKRAAFTLIELLVVIAIIGVLVALLLAGGPEGARGRRPDPVHNNLKQIGLAVPQLTTTPQSCRPCSRRDPGDTWAVLLLPYIEQDKLYKLWDDTDPNRRRYYLQTDQARQTPVKIYYCPTRRAGPPPLSRELRRRQRQSHPRAGRPRAITRPAAVTSGYADYNRRHIRTGTVPPGLTASNGCYGAFGRVEAGDLSVRHRRPEQHDLHRREAHPPGPVRPFTRPRHLQRDRENAITKKAGVGAALAREPNAGGSAIFGSWHPGVCQFVMGDGSVRALAVSIDLNALGWLAQRDDGQVITAGF